MTQNMYRVGDYVYFEISSTGPYQIRKIEELNKNATGQVEARVLCFYRRRDISPALVKIADEASRKFDPFKVYDGDNEIVPEESEEKPVTTNGNGEEKEDGVKKENGDVNGDVKDKEDSKEEKKESEEDVEKNKKREWGMAGLPLGAEKLNEVERHRYRQRELFVSRHVETLPATHIRGKCSVTLLSEVEDTASYDRDDAFYYSLMYDPSQLTLLADKGNIRVGEKFQCVVPEEMGDPDAEEKVKKESEDEDHKENGDLMIADEEAEKEVDAEETAARIKGEREVLVYHPHHSLNDREIDQFLIVARAVGTFSRALDTSSSTKLPSLHMTAAAASRDVTLLHAMALLHQADYDIGQAVKFLVPPPSKAHYPLDADKSTNHKTVSLGGPILCRDQMEEWSAAEANLFEEAIDKYGKDFNDVRNDFLPWKSIRDIVEYYYMWKTTNRYADAKKAKHQEPESKLKQVYIPNYNKPNQALIGQQNTTNQPISTTKACESCATELSLNWYNWGPAALQMRLCSDCWSHWKKFGGLKKRSDYEYYDLEGSPNDLLSGLQQQMARNSNSTVNPLAINKNTPLRPGMPSLTIPGRNQVVARLPVGHLPSGVVPATKAARMSFLMRAEPLTKIARKLASKTREAPLNMRKAARRPFEAVDQTAIRSYCQQQEKTEQLKTVMGVLKVASNALPNTLQQAIVGGTLFVERKRPANGTDPGAPPAKKAPNVVA